MRSIPSEDVCRGVHRAAGPEAGRAAPRKGPEIMLFGGKDGGRAGVRHFALRHLADTDEWANSQ